jgi:hypothetical protein
MKNNVIHILLVTAFSLALPAIARAETAVLKPMQGVPPSRESQVTMGNYRDHPMSRWAFRNAGAPLNVVVIPRQGAIHNLPGPLRPELGEREFTDLHGRKLTFDALFEANMLTAWLLCRAVDCCTSGIFMTSTRIRSISGFP